MASLALVNLLISAVAFGKLPVDVTMLYGCQVSDKKRYSGVDWCQDDMPCWLHLTSDVAPVIEGMKSIRRVGLLGWMMTD